jgi:hypothetical protein
MAQAASHFEMRIILQEFLIDNISQVHFFRPNWRRGACSPLARVFGQLRRFMHRLHQGFIGVTGHATVDDCRRSMRAKKQK